MRVFITSVPEELEPHQAVAIDAARGLGLAPVLRNPAGARGLQPVAACARQVAATDLVLALVGRRRGSTPPPEIGGDGFHPWTWWETRAAFEHGLPVTVLMASGKPEVSPASSRQASHEDGAKSGAVLRDFRGELARLAVLFDVDDVEGFRRLVRDELLEAQREASATVDLIDAKLRRWPPPKLPERPYPVLLPYTHPDLLAGRERELAELRQLLARPVPILGLHAASGTGKSSLLAGGLVPALRAVSPGRVAFDRHPCEPGLAGRLLGDLLDGEIDPALEDPRAFVDRLVAVRLVTGAPPVLVLDQFEDLLRRPESRHERGVVGTLLAASVQRLPGLAEPPCRWLLAYRQEFHGQVFQWLRNVLREAPREGDSLPHDLSGPDRFQAWALPPLGTPAPGTDGRAGAAARIFQAAIEKPLELTSEDGRVFPEITRSGRPRYPWRFAPGGAARLARAFGEARAAHRTAPLAPELQVVLAYLLQRSAPPDGAGVVEVEVPEDPGELIDRALVEHLRRALDDAFPYAASAEAGIAGSTLGRTRALLALRELADAHGRRDEGRSAVDLARAIGHDGRDVLEKLATPQTRLVVLERQGDEQVYVLSHDRMAEVVVRLVDDEGDYVPRGGSRGGIGADLGVDAQLLGLRRFVTLQRELFAAGEAEQATEVPKGHFARIDRHAEALLWNDEGRRWWEACRQRRSLDRRRGRVRRAVAAVAVALLTVAVWVWADRYFERQALLETVAKGEAEAAFAALTAVSGTGSAQIVERLRQREKPFDLLERGLGGVDEERRGAAVLRATELLLPLLAEAPENPERVAAAVWALDLFASSPPLRPAALALRDRILAPLRESRPPPPLPRAGDPGWAAIPAGTFEMGSRPGEGRDGENMADERPRHPVTLSAFRLQVHEVTCAELRRLYPDAAGDDDMPAARLTWHEAYTYAAWLGGRLPTEAESEYAARAGCPFVHCRRDGSAAAVDEVAWWSGNSAGTAHPVMRLEPNPWGLYDVYGNVWEMNANWFYLYSEEPAVDPPGVTVMPENLRQGRGGSYQDAAEWVVPSGRGQMPDGERSYFYGLRVAIPEDWIDRER